MENLIRRRRLAIFAASVMCLCLTSARGQTPDAEALEEARAISLMADAALGEFTVGRDADGHKAILDKALAVAVFPGLHRRSYYIRSRTHGAGLVSRRTRDGWSAPAFYRIKQGRWVLQFGASRDDLIILFLSEDAINQLSKKKFRLGGEASKEMISYSQTEGFNAGMKLRGAVVRPDDALTVAASGGLRRLDVLFTQPKEALTAAEKNGTNLMSARLKSISPAAAPGTVTAKVELANKSKAYYVYFHVAEPTTVTKPRSSGLVADGVIEADPPVDQWNPQSAIVLDANTEWYSVGLPSGAYYHVVCVEQKDQHKELILDKDCLNDCGIICSDVSPPPPPEQSPNRQGGRRPRRKK